MRSEARWDNFIKWLNAEQYPQAAHPPVSFITISRQVGAGGRTLGRQLVNQLNLIDIGDAPWALWDRELVERVAVEERVPQSVIDDLEERRAGNWLNELFAGISMREDPEARDRIELYRRMAAIIRAIARVGRAVLVGRGGVFVTEDIPGGVHVRLVAPLEHRVEQFARERALSRERARAEVHRIEREREAFYHRFFPGKPIVPEQFTITLNTAGISEAKQAGAVIALLHTHEPGEPQTSAAASAAGLVASAGAAS